MSDFSRPPQRRPAEAVVPGFDPAAYHAQLFGPWRAGSELVLLKDEPLPNRCVATNEPADIRRRMRLAWHPPGYYALLLLGPVPYAIVASFATRRETVEVPLGQTWRARRSRMIYLGMAMIVIGILLIVGSPAMKGIDWGWFMLAGFLLLIFGIERAANGARPVKPVKITESMIWLKGAGTAYLSTLPPYLGENALPPIPLPSSPDAPLPPPLPPRTGP